MLYISIMYTYTYIYILYLRHLIQTSTIFCGVSLLIFIFSPGILRTSRSILPRRMVDSPENSLNRSTRRTWQLGKWNQPENAPGWWFQISFIFTPNFGEMIRFDKHILKMGWLNHQPGQVWIVFLGKLINIFLEAIGFMVLVYSPTFGLINLFTSSHTHGICGIFVPPILVFSHLGQFRGDFPLP